MPARTSDDTQPVQSNPQPSTEVLSYCADESLPEEERLCTDGILGEMVCEYRDCDESPLGEEHILRLSCTASVCEEMLRNHRERRRNRDGGENEEAAEEKKLLRSQSSSPAPGITMDSPKLNHLLQLSMTESMLMNGLEFRGVDTSVPTGRDAHTPDKASR